MKFPESGDLRIVKKFCWFPRWFGNEIIWFETIYVLQQYDCDFLGAEWNDLREATYEEMFYFSGGEIFSVEKHNECCNDVIIDPV